MKILNLFLAEVQVKNLLSFKDAIFKDLKNFNVIIGKNNAGKSNLFKILQIVQQNLNNSAINQVLLFNNDIQLEGQITLHFKFSEIFVKNLLLKLDSSNRFFEIIKFETDIPNLNK